MEHSESSQNNAQAEQLNYRTIEDVSRLRSKMGSVESDMIAEFRRNLFACLRAGVRAVNNCLAAWQKRSVR